MEPIPFHIQVIRDNLGLRQRNNSTYSLRAYGRDLGLDASTLSQVLKGKRPFPAKSCERVITRLRLSPIDRAKFVESALRKLVILDRLPLASQEGRYLLDESQYRIIAEWEHYAALHLLETEGFVLSANSVADRLGITLPRAETVIQNLYSAQLIQLNGDRYELVHSSVKTTEDITSAALRQSHIEALEMGKGKIEEVATEMRDFSSMTFAFDLEQMVELKAVIREFRKKVASLSQRGKNRTEVYQLAIQTYPLTKLEQKGTV